MKKPLESIGYILFGLSVVLLVCIIVLYNSDINSQVTGQIGDTFGGLFSPFIGIITIYFLVRTFNEQRAQFTEQMNHLIEERNILQKEAENREKENLRLRDKEQVDRLTDINYRQIQRIDDNLRFQEFEVYGDEKIEGRRGLYALNNEIKSDLDYLDNEIEEDSFKRRAIQRIYQVVDKNIDPLTDYFDHLFISLAIVNRNIENANFRDTSHAKEILRIFLLNLSASYEENLNLYKKTFNLIKDEMSISPNTSIDRLIKLFDEVYDMSINAADKVINNY